ncbi:MAG: hypothetical protein HQ523_03635 [Lentisphaerae bacterium]|nr:hypothetical protein [Lentisphaerota bacterium]
MKAQQNRHRIVGWTTEEGSAMVIVLCMAGLMLMAAFAISMISGSMARKSTKITHGVQALAIAEAGVADALERMSTNYVAGMDMTFTSDYGEGSYVVSTTTDMSTAAVVIESEGQSQGERRSTVVELLGDISLLRDRALGAGDAILAEGDVTLETAALQINGSVHANGNVLHSTGNTQVNGDVSAVGIVQVGVAGGYSQLPNSARIPVPDFQPFDAWKAAAIAGGIYYPSSVTLSGSSITPANGIVYVDGDVEISNNSGMTGTLVASGSITINNRFYQTSFNTNWPCLLAGMNIGLHNRNTYYGVIFAGNDIVSRNNRDITGALVALNNIYVENHAVINPLTQSPAWTPEGSNATPEVVVGGWLR